MNADRLFAFYNHVADAPDAVKRLRRFVLDLAVRGELVEQDPADEPANELLKRIATERAKLAEARVIRKPKPMEKLDEPPFAIPPSWKWTRLGELAELVRGVSFPASAKSNEPSEGLLPCLRSGNIQTGIVWDNLIYVPESVIKSAAKLIRLGDVLISIANSYALVGKCSIVGAMPYRATFGAFLAAIRFHLILPEYARLFLKSNFSSSAFRAGSSQTTNIANITFSTIRGHPLPLPPLAEQHRIVTKVDELMALCDQLGEMRAAREKIRNRLTKATLTRLSTPDPDVPTFHSHVRFAVDALPALTTRADQINHLRKVILSLAVRGKLVKQNPADEPVDELLKRIDEEKDRPAKAGAIRKPKAIVLPNTDNFPFPIPWSWKWTQIAKLGIINPRNEAPDDHLASFVPMSLIAAEYGKSSQHEARRWGEIKKGYTHFAEGDVGLAKITPCFENGKSTVFRNLTGSIGSGTTELHVVRPLHVIAEYIVLFLKSPDFIKTGTLRMTGTAGQKRVPSEYFTSSPFPLPPLAEQHRVVAKVNELMSLCDQLEADIADADHTRTQLLESLLHDALATAVHEVTAASWLEA